MKILDWYILKRYLGTFSLFMLLFIPIAIVANVAEKIGKILSSDATTGETLTYYLDFSIYLSDQLMPIMVLLSVIWFTSKLANNTEVIAFLSSGVSFLRFLRPYLVGATIIFLLALVTSLFIAPDASAGYNQYKYEHLKRRKADRDNTQVYRQIADDEYVYVSHYQPRNKLGSSFSLEKFDGEVMTHKITGNSIQPSRENDSLFTIRAYVKRTIIDGGRDIIEREVRKDTIFNFQLDDLTPVNYVAETLTFPELVDFINREEERGSAYIGSYKVTAHKRWSVPVSIYILTIIAVAMSSKKRRGGMGVNLALGIVIGMVFIFFDRIFGTLAKQSTFDPALAAWFPNIVFAIVALYLLNNARK